MLKTVHSFGPNVPVLSEEEPTLKGDGTDMLTVPEPAPVPLLQIVMVNVPLNPWLVVQTKLLLGLIPAWAM